MSTFARTCQYFPALASIDSISNTLRALIHLLTWPELASTFQHFPIKKIPRALSVAEQWALSGAR